MKKLTVLFVSLLLIMSLAVGCSATTSTTIAQGGDASITTASSEDTNASSGSSAGETITLLSWYNEQIMSPYLDDFEKETGIKVDLQFVPPVQQYVDKFMVLSASDQMTDLFFTAAENKEDIIAKNLAVPLNDLPVFARINKDTAMTYGNDGKILAYSPDAWVGGIFYNKDLFDQAGIKSEPKNWDEFTAALKALKALGIEPLVSGSEQVHEIPTALYVSSVISKNPRMDYDINEGKTTFAAQYTDSFKAWYEDVYAAGLFSQISLGLNGDQAMDMFVTGQSAMYSGGPWNIGTFEEKNPDLNYDIFPLPDKDGNAVLTGALNVGLSISSTSDKQEAAWKFLEFMSRDENILRWQKSTGNVLIVDGLDYELDTVINQFKDDGVKGNFYLSQLVWKNSAAIYKELLTGIQDAMTGADKIENVPVRMDQKMAELG